MRRRTQSGAVLIETAMWVPFLVLLFIGTVELSRVTYTYYTLHKILYTVARTAGTQTGINFCDEGDANLAAIKAQAVTGTPDGTGAPLLAGLTAELVAVRLERYLPESTSIVECACEASATGCDAAQGARAPDYLVAHLPNGYPVTLRFPGLLNDPIALRPAVRVPFGGL